jgi:hypothetical protein
LIDSNKKNLNKKNSELKKGIDKIPKEKQII